MMPNVSRKIVNFLLSLALLKTNLPPNAQDKVLVFPLSYIFKYLSNTINYFPPPDLFSSFFLFWHSQPCTHPATAGIAPAQSISIGRGPIKPLCKCLSVLPVNQCIPSADSFCRERAGSNSKCFFKLPGLIAGSCEWCPTETTAFFPSSPSPFSTTLRCDQDAAPNALARVPTGLLPRTRVNRLLRVFPGLQGNLKSTITN